MWFFMISCYLLTAATTIMLFLTALQGHFHFNIFKATHPTFALLTIIFYLFTQTLVIFYFVGVGVSVKEYIQMHQLDPAYHRRSIAIKQKVYPPLLLNILLMMILFISGGAVDTKHLAGWLHGLLFYVSFFHFFKVIVVEHESFKEMTAIVLQMSGVIQP